MTLRTNHSPVLVNDTYYCAAPHCHGPVEARGEHGYACLECGLLMAATDAGVSVVPKATYYTAEAAAAVALSNAPAQPAWSAWENVTQALHTTEPLPGVEPVLVTETH